jgi:hypothetical protein
MLAHKMAASHDDRAHQAGAERMHRRGKSYKLASELSLLLNLLAKPLRCFGQCLLVFAAVGSKREMMPWIRRGALVDKSKN